MGKNIMQGDMTNPFSRDVLEAEILHTARRLDEAANLTRQAHLFAALRDYGHAEPLYWQALKIKEDALGVGSLEVATCLEDLAELYEMRHEYANAKALYERAVGVKAQVLGALHPDVIRSAKVLKRFTACERPDRTAPSAPVCDSAAVN